MNLDEINNLKKLWFVGEFKLLKTLMECFGLNMLNLDLYTLLIELNDRGLTTNYYQSSYEDISSINNSYKFTIYGADFNKGDVLNPRLYPFDIIVNDSILGKHYDLREYIQGPRLFRLDNFTLNKIIFELPLDYEPNKLELL